MKANQIAKMIKDYTGFDIKEAYRRNGIDAVIDYVEIGRASCRERV